VQIVQLFDQWRSDWGLTSPDGAKTDALSDRQAQCVLALQLFGAAPSHSILGSAYSQPSAAQSIAEEAWTDWCNRLDGLLGIGACVDVSGATLQDAWDGRLTIHLPWWDGAWSLCLHAEAVQRLLGTDPAGRKTIAPAYPPLAPLQLAIANEPVRLQVQFDPIVLTLGQIQALCFGDVVPIHHRLEDPIAVVMQSTDGVPQPICHAWLGQRDGRIAVELSR